MKYFLVVTFFFFLKNGFTQSLAINTDGSTANTSALLDVKSTNKGLLLPRMTKAQKNAIGTPATGLLVYQTSPDSAGFHYFDGTSWLWLNPVESNDWKITGNAGTDTAVNFIGTSDNVPLHFKVNNQIVQRFVPQRSNYFIGLGAGGLFNGTSSGQIAIGDSAGASLIAIGNGIYIGNKAGKSLISGPNNNIIGASAGLNITSGSINNLFGVFAGRFITTGAQNTFIGHQAGDSSTTAFGNTAMGVLSLSNNKQGRFNIGIGHRANVGEDSLVNAIAIGSNSFVDTSNAMVLGSINGENLATANTNVAIGTTKPKAALHVSRGNYGGNLVIPSSRNLLIEDNANTYIQLLNPTAFESGILAGNSVTTIKSAVVFTPDSAIQFRTGGNFNNDMYIANDGRVGIGTVTPSGTLHLVQNGFNLPNAKYTSFPAAIFENGNAFGNSAIQLMCKSTNDFSIFSGTDSISRRSDITFNSDSSISFGTGLSLQSVLIAKNGNVGIGIFTPNPVAKLDANGTFRLGLSGSINSALIKDTINIDVPSIAADGEQTVNIVLTGATTNGSVSLSPGVDLPTGIIIAWARVSSSGNVRIRFKNTSASPIDPIPMNYFISVVQ